MRLFFCFYETVTRARNATATLESIEDATSQTAPKAGITIPTLDIW
jgi:hypothetical protein